MKQLMLDIIESVDIEIDADIDFIKISRRLKDKPPSPANDPFH